MLSMRRARSGCEQKNDGLCSGFLVGIGRAQPQVQKEAVVEVLVIDLFERWLSSFEKMLHEM
jgi:hypothetical protein